jgi:hypothetical protein
MASIIINPFTGDLIPSTPGPAGPSGATGSISGAPAGSAAAPSIAFTGDTNTGIYSPGADQIAVATNGTGRLFITSTGSIGVGTSTPNKFSAATGFTVNGADAGIELSTSDVLKSIFYTNGVDTVLSNVADGALRFNTNSTEKLRITSAGLVGIGTSGPGRNVDIVSSDTWIRIARTGGNAWLIGPGVQDAFRIYDDTAGQERFRIEATTGNVGIGTTSPGGQLDCYTSLYQRLLVTYPSTYVTKLQLGSFGYIQSDAGTDAYTIDAGAASSANIRFNTYTGERARIDNLGKLLVGTSTANSLAGLAANVQSEGNASTGGLIAWANVNTSQGSYLALGKSRGTVSGSNTIIQDGDQLGIVYFFGADGVDRDSWAASIAAEVDGTPGTNDMPGRLVFSTTADGAASPTERMRIKSTGIINFSNAPTYADNTTAAAAGLAVGDVYKTVLGVLMIRY